MRADQERARADQERTRADQERNRADVERSRAEAARTSANSRAASTELLESDRVHQLDLARDLGYQTKRAEELEVRESIHLAFIHTPVQEV